MDPQPAWCARCRGVVADGWLLVLVREGPVDPLRREVRLCPPCAADLGAFMAGRDAANHHRRPG